MTWQLVLPPQAEIEIRAAAAWYDSQQEDLGQVFQDEILKVIRSLAINPRLNSKRHASLDVRWRSTERFPYRVIYEIHESERRVVVAAILHASRHDRQWQRRFPRIPG
jgi:toxin ParE1/3/4